MASRNISLPERAGVILGIILAVFMMLSNLAIASAVAGLLVAPADTDESIYSTGTGSSAKDAERDAMTALAQRLASNVKVEQKLHIEKRNASVSRHFEQSTRISSEQLPFPPLQIIDSTVHDHVHTVVVKVSRQTLVRFYDALVSRHLQKYEDSIALAKHQAGIDAVRILQSQASLVAELNTGLRLLNGIDGYQDSKGMTDRYLLASATAEKIKARTGWELKSGHNATGITAALSEKLAEQGFSSSGEKQYLVWINTKEKYGKQANRFLARIELAIEVRPRDQLERLIARSVFTVQGESAQSKTLAANDATQKMIHLIKNTTINKLLNI